jgi:DNA-binding FadR family transcriptional regulator
MGRCIRASRKAESWRQYETFDNRLHRLVAEAAGNTVLTALFDQLNAVRRAVVWGRTRAASDCPPADHHSFADHDRMFEAISARDANAASAAMLAHLRTVQSHLLGIMAAAE